MPGHHREPVRPPGVTILPAPFTICVQDIPNDARIGPHQHIDLIYVLTPSNGHLTPQAAEVSRCAWVPIDDIVSFDTPPELPDLIRQAASYAHACKAARPLRES